MNKVIYDFGSNNGDDIPYYLLKADLVVAVEANPSLCNQIRSRFSSAIAEKRLVIECCVINDIETDEKVPFYIHEDNHVLSQFPAPDKDHCQEFTQIQLPSKTATQIILEHGDPYYIKIDIEHYDFQILKSIFESDIRPPYISAEFHNSNIFDLLVQNGKYNAFKLVEGDFISVDYANRRISTNQGKLVYSFPYHSAGPFGEDIPGRWSSAFSFSMLLSYEGCGWKDIHATSKPKRPPTNLKSGIAIRFFLKSKRLRRRLKALKCRALMFLRRCLGRGPQF